MSKIISFTKEELNLIHQHTELVPFRVLETTNLKDLEILRTPSLEVETKNVDLALLIQRMHATVTDQNSKGVGIAAPQIGINRQVILVQRVDKDKEFEFYVNPKIIWKSEILREGDEGCLSIPDIYQSVKRSLIITVQYQNLEGSVFTETLEGFISVIFQHEIDHLNGVLFTDYSNINENSYIAATDIHQLHYLK